MCVETLSAAANDAKTVSRVKRRWFRNQNQNNTVEVTCFVAVPGGTVWFSLRAGRYIRSWRRISRSVRRRGRVHYPLVADSSNRFGPYSTLLAGKHEIDVFRSVPRSVVSRAIQNTPFVLRLHFITSFSVRKRTSALM